MATNPQDMFHRVLSKRTYLRGSGLALVIWSIAAAIVTCLALLTLFLIVDLLDHRGEARLTYDEAAQLDGSLLVGADVPPPAEDANDEPGPNDEPVQNEPSVPNADGAALVHWQDHGLLASAARSDRPLVRTLLQTLAHKIPMLQYNRAALTILILIGCLLGMTGTILRGLSSVASHRVATASAMNLRKHLYRQAIRLGPSDLDGRGRDELQTLFSADASEIRSQLQQWLRHIIYEPAMIVLLLAILFLVDPKIAFMCLVPLAGCGWMAWQGAVQGRQNRRLAESEADEDLRALSASLDRTRIVRGYGMEEFDLARFETHLGRFAKKIMGGWTSSSSIRRLTHALVILCIGLAIYFIGMRVLDAESTFSLADGMLVMLCLTGLFLAVSRLMNLVDTHQLVSKASGRVHTYLKRIPEVGQAVGAKFLDPMTKSIIYESVSYTGADGRPLIDRLELRIPVGQITAFVSLDPIAARAATYMLPRFVEPAAGRILFDSEDTAWATLESLRAETILVRGDDPVIEGTVMENISCGSDEFGLPEVTEAAKLVHAHKMVLRRPHGYETMLGDHGETLNVGERFLLGLARAVLRKPAILIIEEPSAPLDEDTKALLDDAYQRIAKGSTLIFLPRRLSTLRRCEQVVFLHEGRVNATGTHNDLLKSHDLYRHWEYVHFNPVARTRSTDAEQGATT